MSVEGEAATLSAVEGGSPQVARATCYAMFAYDVAPFIDLAACEERVRSAKQRQTIEKRRSLEYFRYRPAPLRVRQETQPVRVGEHETRSVVDLVFYDFGAITVSFAIPFAGPLGDLVALSGALYESSELGMAARLTLEEVLRLFDGDRIHVAEVVEDYVVFHLEETEPAISPADLYTTYAMSSAQLLRAEKERLSEQEVSEALSARIAFGSSDLTLIDWNAALLYGRGVEDLLTVIEFANVQLLEMRFLDRQLDEALEESYALVSRRRPRWLAGFQLHARGLRRIAGLEVDGAILFERVTNALKVFGEEYLSRVYTLTADRLRLSAWDASAMRKLGTIDTIYAKLTDQAAIRRLEFLEWIIVFLITLSIVLSFF